jgi:hypothetical protein
MNLDLCSSHSSECPNSQTSWVGVSSLEALTRLASSPPSPKSGRGFYIAQTNRMFGFSSLHYCHTTQHQNSLLLMLGEGSGMRVENTAASSVTARNSFFRATLGKDKLHPYETLVFEARA